MMGIFGELCLLFSFAVKILGYDVFYQGKDSKIQGNK